ncbi:MAG: recombination protein RecR [Alistipes sp.]|nr:recombination protein RecR [Candidatus Alistipes equi]
MSQLLDNLNQELSRLPGVGQRTAMRLAMHILKKPVEEARFLSDAIISFRENIHFCSQCGNLSDEDVCEICLDSHRDASTLCIVEQVADLLSIEKTHQYNGLYCVLGGVISPIHNIGPSDLRMDLVHEAVKRGMVKEIIIALPASIEGETTLYYIKNSLQYASGISFTTIARGIGFGDELEYVDEHTITQALLNRRELR